MQDNPISTFWNIIRKDVAEHTAAPWRLGVVTSVGPLAVQLAGENLTGRDLLVNPLLLEHERSVSLSGLSGGLTGSPESLQVSTGSLTGGARLGGALAPGDRVVLLQSADGQQYVVLCKVVGA